MAVVIKQFQTIQIATQNVAWIGFTLTKCFLQVIVSGLINSLLLI